MDGRDNNEADSRSKPGDAGWGGRRSRDDTPSFIRNVQARAEMLHPSRDGSEALPVLKMPASIRLWRKIRWPLFVALVLALLAAVAVFTSDRLEARSVVSRIEDAQELEAEGTISALVEAEQILSTLAERHPERANARLAWAWQAVLLAEVFGPAGDYAAKAREALDGVDAGKSSVGRAARAGLHYLEGENAAALEEVASCLDEHAGGPRLHLVQALVSLALGKRDRAHEVFEKIRREHEEYLPATHLQLTAAIEADDREQMRELSSDLTAGSSDNLFAALARIAAVLPSWGERTLPTERVAELTQVVRAMEPRIEKAPLRIAMLGRRVMGRTLLMAGEPDRAAEHLEFVVNRSSDPEQLAWYARAIRRFDGPDAALEVLEDRPDIESPEIREVRVRCRLARYEIERAAEEFAELEKSGRLKSSVRELRWVLAVRLGDLATAKSALPDSLDESHLWLALDMYRLLTDSGDAKGIGTLVERLEKIDASCAGAIRAWHHGPVRDAYDALDLSGKHGPCVDALAARLLRGHADPNEVAKTAQRAASASGNDPAREMTRALALWLAEGHQRAVEVLDELRSRSAQGAPVRHGLAESYLEIGLPQPALELVSEADGARDLAIRIAALDALGRGKKRDAAIDAAARRVRKGEDHPALAYWLMKRDLQLSAFDRVAERGVEAVRNGGRWTAEIAELRARAMNTMGSRGDADRSLETAAQWARKRVGRGESWQAKLGIVRLNLRRGGNFLYRAVATISQLYKAGVQDAELLYSYAVANIRQGNERGALRYLRDAVQLDPSFVPAFEQLSVLGKLKDDERALLENARPDVRL
ncbi:MAG: hypothetical protein R6V85_02105 [Polyangia bacterium]